MVAPTGNVTPGKTGHRGRQEIAAELWGGVSELKIYLYYNNICRFVEENYTVGKFKFQ